MIRRSLRGGTCLVLKLTVLLLLVCLFLYNYCILVFGERSEPHTYRTVGKNLRHIYIYVFYIYIYIYIRPYVVHVPVNGHNRLENGARYAQTSDRPAEVQWSI